MRDVQSDERVSFGFDINAASVDQLLAWVYPRLYPVHDPAGDWGRPGPDGRCAAGLPRPNLARLLPPGSTQD